MMKHGKNPRTRAKRRWRMQAAGIAAVTAFFSAGCDTFSADLQALQEDLMPPKPSEAAIWMFDPYDAEKRRKGVTLIANSPFGGAEVYVRAYEDFLRNEENPIVLASAIRALARHGNPSHAPLIASHLSHESQQVRWEAAKGLQRLHNPEVVPDLRAALLSSTESADVRMECAEALGQYPEDRVFQALVAALDAKELGVNMLAEQSLNAITGQSLGQDQRAWLEWYVSTDTPFARQKVYLYPTYRRPTTLFEHIAFWTRKTWEQPMPPAGLRGEGRSTYENDGEVGEGTSPPDEGASG